MIEDKFQIFDDDGWFLKLDETYRSHKMLVNYINNDDAFFAFHDSEESFENEDENTQTLENAKSLYSRQMLVSFCTYIEIIIYDFASAIFTEKPELMCEYLLPKLDEVQCKELISRQNIDKETIISLSSTVIESTFSYKIKNSLKKLNKVSGGKTNLIRKYEKKLTSVFNVRNAIVHENKDGIDKLELWVNYYYSILAPSFVEDLGKICDSLGIERTRKEYEDAMKPLEKLINLGELDSSFEKLPELSNIIPFPKRT